MAKTTVKRQRSKTTSFRVGRVRAFLRGKVWYLYYHEHGRRRQPRVGPDRDLARQVAAELFLSPRTVSYHLSSVYRKLGVTNRTALASRLADWTSAGAGVG